MGNANARQVGGDHYKTDGIQHWDLFGPDYLIGYATKYMRWRKKGGVQDLEKAIHVIEKLKERLQERARPMYDRASVATWCDGAGLDWTERRIVHLIMFGFEEDSLDEAIAGIHHLISTHAPKVVETDAGGRIRKVIGKVKIYTTMTDDEFRAEMKQRTPEDGAQHAGVAPWCVHMDWFLLDGQRAPHQLIDLFWRQRMSTMFVLEPHVHSPKLPKILAGVYRPQGAADWILKIENCPSDMREFFPNLGLEKNMKEFEELPAWQAELYAWDKGDNKYRLAHLAWHVTEDDEQ